MDRKDRKNKVPSDESGILDMAGKGISSQNNVETKVDISVKTWRDTSVLWTFSGADTKIVTTFVWRTTKLELYFNQS